MYVITKKITPERFPASLASLTAIRFGGASFPSRARQRGYFFLSPGDSTFAYPNVYAEKWAERNIFKVAPPEVRVSPISQQLRRGIHDVNMLGWLISAEPTGL